MNPRQKLNALHFATAKRMATRLVNDPDVDHTDIKYHYDWGDPALAVNPPMPRFDILKED